MYETVIYITDDTPKLAHNQKTRIRRLKRVACFCLRWEDAVMREFIKAFGGGAAFDPDTVQILIGAFDDAWASFLNSDAPFAAENHSETARDILAKHIIEAAKNGERDRHKLSEGALLQLAGPNLKKPLR